MLTSTPDGFLAGGFQQASTGQQAVIWISRDGVTWQRFRRRGAVHPGRRGPGRRGLDLGGRSELDAGGVSGLTEGGSHDLSALALAGSAVTGIDSVQTQAGQQFVVRRLPAG